MESIEWLWKKDKFKAKNLIFLPLHKNNHWSLLAIKNFRNSFNRYLRCKDASKISISIYSLDSLQEFEDHEFLETLIDILDVVFTNLVIKKESSVEIRELPLIKRKNIFFERLSVPL